VNPPLAAPAGTAELLTGDEREAVRQAGLLHQLISKRIIAHGPARDEDITELTTAIHVIQRMVMGQAAARAYPGRYRLLGQVVPITEELQ
jgi:hypothetical protein